MLSFEVEGIPIPQGSKNAWVVPGTRRANVVDVQSPALKAWRRLIGVAAAKAVRASDDDPRLQSDALAVELTFFMPRPKSHWRTGRNAHLLRATSPEFPSSAPDSDKLTRAVFDALKTLVWKDDAQVVTYSVMELFADGCPPGCHVTVRSVYE